MKRIFKIDQASICKKLTVIKHMNKTMKINHSSDSTIFRELLSSRFFYCNAQPNIFVVSTRRSNKKNQQDINIDRNKMSRPMKGTMYSKTYTIKKCEVKQLHIQK